jgi:signal peptide peptidase SppA
MTGIEAASRGWHCATRSPDLRFVRPILLACGAVFWGGCQLPQPIDVRTRVIVEPQPVKDVAPIVEMPVSGKPNCGPRVAIVDVDGILVNENETGLMSVGANPIDQFRAKLDYAARQPEITAVVVRINSPGGGVTACDIMHRDLQRFRESTGKPVVACLMDVATGGGYYLATASDLIVAHPTTVTGGLGIILNLYNLEDMLAQFNIVGVAVKSGKHIDAGSPIRTMSPESRKLLERMARDLHARFRESIIRGRGLPLSIEMPVSQADDDAEGGAAQGEEQDPSGSDDSDRDSDSESDSGMNSDARETLTDRSDRQAATQGAGDGGDAEDRPGRGDGQASATKEEGRGNVEQKDQDRGGRGVQRRVEAVDIFDGRVMLAPEALRLGLLDSIGYLDDAIVQAAGQGVVGGGDAGGRPVGNVAAVILHGKRDPVQSLYGITPNQGIEGKLLSLDVPGLSRQSLPTFLFMWQPDPSLR